ncbi:MAG: cadmium-translocating P-type ATPase [Armatimonadetes bacterium]|nr:cadmium-translocating P-type ATPase [Planctomycetota bacterium]MBI2200565.1 cadmium-translocating P-type ATPase [Armatimonadota bacterium]
MNAEARLDLAEMERVETRVRQHLVIAFMGGALLLNDLWISLQFPADREVGALSSLLAALLMGLPILLNALEDLIRSRLRMTELVALAIVASIARQDYPIAGVISFFVLVSEAIERRTAMGARKAIESLIRLTPSTARLVTEHGEEDVPVQSLRPGQTIRIRSGENIPADGRVRRGQSSVNQASITGESVPADKLPGSEVFAGTANLTGSLDVEVTVVGPETTLGKVRELILRAQTTKSPMMQIVEQHAQWYTPAMLMIAGVILYFTREMDRAVTALVIACPGAIVLAAPTAMVAAISCAARLGILVKNAADLELAGKLTAMIFDKTGTLTTGRLDVTRLSPAPGTPPEDIVRLAASAERDSNHPAARALNRLAQEAAVPLAAPAEFHETPGRGVQALVDRQIVRVGRQSWLEEQGIDCSDAARGLDDAEALSAIFVSRDRQCLGWIGLEDRPREEARHATWELNRLGIRRLIMLTGDRQVVARKVANELGCAEFEAECLPETKLQILEGLRQHHYQIAVIGDGVNDAPALAAADLGIAMGAAGNDIAVNSASIALMNNDLSRIPFLVRLSRRTRRVIHQNLLFGVFFILAGLALSAFGWLSPAVAAFLYLISSLIVVFNSARLIRFGEELSPHDVFGTDSATSTPDAAPA